MSTFASCIITNTNQPIRVELTLDHSLVSASSLSISFKGIQNLASELGSGTVIVYTKYNSIMIDDTGTDESDRTVTTSSYGMDLPFSHLVISPSTEAYPATYSMTLLPPVSFPSSAIILLSFPSYFNRALGSTLHCSLPSL